MINTPIHYEVFTDGNSYINHLRLFHMLYGTVANIKTIHNIDTNLLRKTIKEDEKDNILVEYYNQTYLKEKKENQYLDHFFNLNNGILINIYRTEVYLLFEPKNEILAQEYQNKYLKFEKKETKTKEISLIINSGNYLSTREIEIKKLKIDLNLHYNEGFKEVHQIILKTLKINNSKGLFLFHGEPGTGKSTYIKYLIHSQKKKVVFLSPKMAGNLDAMAFTEFLIDNKNIVLVIEDAEDLIISRENHPNSQLSFLLNLTDGLLADSLGIQIIATFNTELKNIDKALLRKGRLSAIYEFKPLATDRANILLKSLGVNDFTTKKPMILADIFNYNSDNFSESKSTKSIGF
jgi:hypothetical protein